MAHSYIGEGEEMDTTQHQPSPQIILDSLPPTAHHQHVTTL